MYYPSLPSVIIMNKENNRSAAGLRRSAIAERLRLREEWSALKGVDSDIIQHKKVLNKKPQNVFKPNRPQIKDVKKFPVRQQTTSEALRGVVAFVDVGAETRALALRAALMALGASVVPAWSPLVTHLIWSHGGCRKVRARARALACQLVSPLWVEACASAAQRLPERIFPAPTRPSDLPSPATLRQLLKKAEHENIPLADLLSDSRESEDDKTTRLRMSSETEHSHERSADKSLDKSTDKSRDASHDKSRDQSRDESRDVPHYKKKIAVDSPSIAYRVNTQPRRALPATPQSPPPAKSRRKLFTHKEADVITTDDDKEATPTPARPKKMQPLTQQQRREFVRAERIARKLIKTPIKKQTNRQIAGTQKQISPRIVLTGMSKLERHEVFNAIRTLNGKIQSNVNRKTTHILLGSCKEEGDINNHQINNLGNNNQGRNKPGSNNHQINYHETHKPGYNNQEVNKPGYNNQRLNNHQINNHETHKPGYNNQEVNKPGYNNPDSNSQIIINQEINQNNQLVNSEEQSNRHNLSMCNQCNNPEDILEKLFSDINIMVDDHCNHDVTVPHGVTIICTKKLQLSGVTTLSSSVVSEKVANNRCKITEVVNKNINKIYNNIRIESDNFGQKTAENINKSKNVINKNHKTDNLNEKNDKEVQKGQNNCVNKDTSVMCSVDVVNNKPRTVNALLGAVRGCRVLRAQWAIDSAKEGHWIPHYGYEVPHLLKISQKARVERSALGRMRSEYAYDIFNGIRVCVRPNAPQKPAITQLLTLCGGHVQDGDCDVTIGPGEAEVNSKWVFDSVAAGRMRNTRRYINKTIPNHVVNLTQSLEHIP